MEKLNLKTFALKILSFTFIFSLLCCTFALAEDNSAGGEVSFTLRIEGINKTAFYGEVTVPAAEGSTTLKDAMIYISASNNELAVKGAEEDYITDINGDTAGKFGGWDGWLFTVNGVEAATGMSGCTLKGGESVVFYYGDPYGIGMQFPVMDTAALDNGTIIFTSSDTTYDDNYNPTVTVNPVADMEVTLTGQNGITESYKTDKDGKIDISSTKLTGNTSVSIAKYAENGCPLVLRFAHDTEINIPDFTQSVPTGTPDTPVKNENTGDLTAPVIIILSICTALTAAAVGKRGKSL